jgi:hypothetical protein
MTRLAIALALCLAAPAARAGEPYCPINFDTYVAGECLCQGHTGECECRRNLPNGDEAYFIMSESCLERHANGSPVTVQGSVVYGRDPPLRAFICPDDWAMICVTGVDGLHTEYRFKAEVGR